jgi:hypothetical protein
LRACYSCRAGDFGDSAEVVSEIGVEWTERLVDRERHGGEEFHTVGLSLRAQSHDAIEEAVSALARREVRDVRSPRGVPILCGGREWCVGHRSSGGWFTRSPEALAGEKRDESKEGNRGNAPWKD